MDLVGKGSSTVVAWMGIVAVCQLFIFKFKAVLFLFVSNVVCLFVCLFSCSVC